MRKLRSQDKVRQGCHQCDGELRDRELVRMQGGFLMLGNRLWPFRVGGGLQMRAG